MFSNIILYILSMPFFAGNTVLHVVQCENMNTHFLIIIYDKLFYANIVYIKNVF